MPNGTSAFEAQYQRGPILGRGASGVAFVVRPKQDPEQQYVAKELCIVRADAKRRRDAFAESQMLRELSHKNIIRCFDVFQDEELMYIIMEYANGGDLSTRLQSQRTQNTRFLEATVMTVFVQICAALNYIHSRKIVHRDLKPPNVFVVGESDLQHCTVKLGDFGIAKMIESTCGQAHSTVGTPSYLSPEICKNNPYGRQSDIWSLGIILYELACLKVPFHAGNLPAMALMICTSEPKPLPDEFSPDLGSLVKSLLQKDPLKRPQVGGVLQSPYVNRQLPEDVRAEILATSKAGGGGSTSSTAGGGRSARAVANGTSATSASATDTGDSATKSCMPDVSVSSISNVSGDKAGFGGSGSARGGAGSRNSDRPPPQPPPPGQEQLKRGNSQPSLGSGSRGGARQNGFSDSGGARLPSCGPARRERHDKTQEDGASWAWRRPSDAERALEKPGQGKSRPTPGGGKEKDRDRARPRSELGGDRERAAEDRPKTKADRADRAAQNQRHQNATESRGGEHPMQRSIDPRGDQQHRLTAAAERAAATLATEQAGQCSRPATDQGGPRCGGYDTTGSSLGASWLPQYLMASGDPRQYSSQSAPSSAPAGSGLTGWEMEAVTPDHSGLVDPDEDLYHQNGFNATTGTNVESIVSHTEMVRQVSDHMVRPPADLMDPIPPFAEPPNSAGSITALIGGNSGDSYPRVRTRIRRNRGRPPLIAGQEAMDTGTFGGSPTRCRPSARGLEAASCSPGMPDQTFNSTAVSASLSLSAQLQAARSVSPGRRTAALREEQQQLPQVPTMRSSGSAPALPPLPPLVAPTRGAVPRSRSVVGLQTEGRASRDAETGGKGRGYVEPLQREPVPHMFRTAPLPIGADRSGDIGSSAIQDGQGPPPPSLAPPPSQPPPPPPQRQAARDESASAVRLAGKLPNAMVGQSERHWRDPPTREGREPPPGVGHPAEGWGDGLASARLGSTLQSVV